MRGPAKSGPLRSSPARPRAYLPAESRHESDGERDEKNTAESSHWHSNTGGAPVRFRQQIVGRGEQEAPRGHAEEDGQALHGDLRFKQHYPTEHRRQGIRKEKPVFPRPREFSPSYQEHRIEAIAEIMRNNSDGDNQAYAPGDECRCGDRRSIQRTVCD